MYILSLKSLPRFYKNNGQHAEQVVRYTLTGRIMRADNKPHSAAADCGNLQIKSARATVCAGTDIFSYIEADVATSYGYVTADFSRIYIMTPEEYIIFVQAFGTVTKNSEKNGGKEKIRLKSENWDMISWLNSYVK